MNKIGWFRGIPVYVLHYSHEYQAIENYEEKMYVCEGKVYYHGVKIATFNGKDLKDFDEAKFYELQAKGWYQDGAEMLGRVTASAETRPQEEKKPDKRPDERDAANDIVEQFMNSWRKNIDNEIAVLKNVVAQME